MQNEKIQIFTFDPAYQGLKDFTANFCPAPKFLFYGIGNSMRMVAEFLIHVSTSTLMAFFKYFT